MSAGWERVEPSIHRRGDKRNYEYKVIYRKRGEVNPTSKAGFFTLAEARAFKAEMDAERRRVDDYGGFMPKGSTPLLEDAISAYIDRCRTLERAPNTIRNYEKSHLRIRKATSKRGVSWLLDRVRIGELHQLQAEMLLADLKQEGGTPRTINTTMGLLGAVHKYAIETRVIPVTQQFTVPLLPVENRRFVLEAVDFAKLLGGVAERYRAMVFLLGTTGMRAAEAQGLTLEAVPALRRGVDRRWTVDTWEGPQCLIIDRQLYWPYGHPAQLRRLKTANSVGKLPYSYAQIEVLADHLNRFGPGAELDGRTLLFGTDGPYNMVNHKLLWNQITRAGREQLGKAVTPHALRHLYASIALDGGASLNEVQRLLRHSKASTTADIYGHAFEDSLRSVQDRVTGALFAAPSDGDAVVLPLFAGQQDR